MIIDEDIVAGGVTPFIITKLIERHERERQRYRLLHDYYTVSYTHLTLPTIGLV